MAGEWETFLVAEAPLEIIDGDRGVNYPKQEDFAPSGACLFLNTGNVTTTGFNFSDRSFITKEKDAALRKGKLKRHDIILTTRGTVGNVAIFDDSVPFEELRINSGMVLLRADQSKLLPRFLFQFVRSQLFKEQVAALTTGSAQPQLPIRDIRRVEVPLPPLSEQRAIAGVLGALDDKIELNRRMNATLESMARALFQSWFVDFDPVRAKLDGRQPAGLDPETAALFPDSFEDSESGHIPKGWRVGRVAEVSDFSRKPINPIEFPGETFDHYSLPAYDEGRTPKSELGSAIMSNKLIVTPNSVLLSKLNPHIPRIWLPDLHEKRRSVCSTEFIVASTRLGFSCEFLFSLFTSAAFATTYGTLVTGTTGSHQRIRPESVLEMKTIIPPSELVEAYSNITGPMFERVKRNVTQSRTLATLRDALLPKLLSGELSVAGAEKVSPENSWT